MSTSSTTLRTSQTSRLGAVRHQPVATKSAAQRGRYVRYVLSLIGAGLFLALVFVWVRVQVIQLGYEVSKIRKETRDLTELKNKLRSEVGALKSPARIETIAREQYGMRLPQTSEVVIVGPENGRE